MDPRERRLLIAGIGFLAFSSVYANVVMAPVLGQIARDFGTTPGAAGLVVAAYGVPGIAVAVLAGPYSDQYGRRPFLVGGALIMGGFTALAALAPTFETLVILRALAGVGASLVFPNVQATVGDVFPAYERGRVLSTVVAMNTMASIVGVPIAGILAEATSWRISLALVGFLVIVATVSLLGLVPHRPPGGDIERARELYLRIVRNRSAVAAIVSSLMGALFWFTWVTFVVVFFESVHGLSQGQASTAALTTGLGVLVGSQIGGRLGDRVGHRIVAAGSIALSSVVIVVLTAFDLGLAAAIAANLVLSAVAGARFTTNQALLIEQVPLARGTMLATSSSVVSVGIVIGAAFGGWVVDAFGFPALGVFCATAGLVSTAILLLWVTEERMDLAETSV
ncbi:MAG TPA: MFS transporter [Candidatus Limnocylindria bacterium]|nr:MFS transporter [Candidatus Limnocylindria bacterium]